MGTGPCGGYRVPDQKDGCKAPQIFITYIKAKFATDTISVKSVHSHPLEKKLQVQTQLRRFKIIWVGEADHWGWDGVLDDERGEHVVEEDQVVMELQEDRGLSTESEIEQLEMVMQWRNF